MRKLYNEYFHLPEPEEGVGREKVYITRFIVSIACIIVCMIAMGYNAYAFFTSNVQSNSNRLIASTYDLEVAAEAVGEVRGTAVEDTVVKHMFTLQPGQYKFTLKKPTTASATTGYCRIDVVGKDKSFYTQQIGVVSIDSQMNERVVTIGVDVATVVQFLPCWGTYAGSTTNVDTYLADGAAIQLKANTLAKVTEAVALVTVVPAPAEPVADDPATEPSEPAKEEESQEQNQEESDQNETTDGVDEIITEDDSAEETNQDQPMDIIQDTQTESIE